MKIIVILHLCLAALAAPGLLPPDYSCEWTYSGLYCSFLGITKTITTTGKGGKPTTITTKIRPTPTTITSSICQTFTLATFTTWPPPNLNCGPGFNGPDCRYLGTTITTMINNTPATITTTILPSSYATTRCGVDIVTTVTAT
ncbi:hypothetical protein NKR19_g10153 [Coniochaeta hoffmannii]|uniref:Uncharacterized protein n=1 Tax=Coniochaeta hoffmannii TaxID=91930 RepID=A0AA38RG29_9PEZI|nr:hypothetical protein NKR19_g10153 [Coniochaeta hoffmannii]